MAEFKFGIIGAGLIADFHARAVNDIEGAEIVGFCDSGSGRAKKLADRYNCRAFKNYQELIADDAINIVTIATPSGFHAEPTIAAAEAGKHIICEKPLEVTMEKIDSMIYACEKNSVMLGGIFPFRFNDCWPVLQQAVKAGRFGTITYVGAYVPWWRKDEYYRDSWHGTLALDGGGALMNQSIHTIDLLCAVMPPIESVQAVTSNLGHPQIETEDAAAAVLRFKSGAIGVIYGSTSAWPGRAAQLEISGTQGTVICQDDSFTFWYFEKETDNDKAIREKFSQIKNAAGSADPSAISHRNHTRNFEAFLKALKENKPFRIDGCQARKSVELILAIYKSAKEQKIVNL